MNSRTQALSRTTLAITLALFSTGCTVPAPTAGGPGSLPQMPTDLLGQSDDATGLFGTQGVQLASVPDGGVTGSGDRTDGGTSLTDFVPSAALVSSVHDAQLEQDAAYGRLRQAEDARPHDFVKGCDDPDPYMVDPCANWAAWEGDVADARTELEAAQARTRDLAGELGVAP